MIASLCIDFPVFIKNLDKKEKRVYFNCIQFNFIKYI